MIQWYVISLFLYFPEDKTEYISAGITFLIFVIGALLTMRFIMKVSKRDAQKAKELEEELKMQQDGRENR
jgi:hypothetical protein